MADAQLTEIDMMESMLEKRGVTVEDTANDED
jgi:hypothetical protein